MNTKSDFTYLHYIHPISSIQVLPTSQHPYIQETTKTDTNRILSRIHKSFVSCDHMNCCLQKDTTHQFTYYIYYSYQDKFKYPTIMKIHQVHQ